MRTSTISTGRTVAVSIAAILATGCGEGAPTAASAPTSPSSPETVPFGQKAVLQDLREAVEAADLTVSTVEAGLGVPQENLVRADTDKERKAAALATRLTPCAVFWSPPQEHFSPDDAGPADTRQQLGVVLSALAQRGWKETRPSEEAPLGDDGTYFMASYKKEGWFLNARHAHASALDHVTVVATQEACFDRLTDEEKALVED
ncbi:hypothetical protein ACFV3E_45365 [Streptomyces sp. NPDC059718]